MRKCWRTIWAVVFGCPLLCIGGTYSYASFDYPAGEAFLRGINANGDIVGYFAGSGGTVLISFLTNTQRTLGPSFQYPGAFFTESSGIDGNGQVIGTFSGITSGAFVRSSTGIFTQLPSPPGVTCCSAAAISGNGAIVLSAGNKLYFKAGSTYNAIVIPGAGGALNAANGTGIDNVGNVVGFYYGASTQSFFRDTSGNFRTIFFPGSVYTEVQGMNNLGQAVGFAYLGGSVGHGFLWNGGTNFTTIDYPGAAGTFPYGINDAGVIVGSYAVGVTYHGFIATPVLSGVPGTPAPPTLVLLLTGLGISALYRFGRSFASREKRS